MVIRKFAVFVEGLTEQLFTIKLITELAGNHGVEFEVNNQFGGSLVYKELISTSLNGIHKIHVLIANCCNDGQVKTQIIDRYDYLKQAGYSLIIGLSDVYPKFSYQIKRLQTSLPIGLPNDKSVPIELHLAIMEVEAWFIEEQTHFLEIDNNLTTDKLIAGGFDPQESASELHHPAFILNKIYKTVGKAYNKKEKYFQRTVDAISYEELYETTRNKSSSLDKFIESLEKGIFN